MIRYTGFTSEKSRTTKVKFDSYDSYIIPCCKRVCATQTSSGIEEICEGAVKASRISSAEQYVKCGLKTESINMTDQSINQSFVDAPCVGLNKSNRGSGRHVIRQTPGRTNEF